MVYGYIRVSTEKQTTENQKLAIKKYCKEKRIHNIKWVSETISGLKKVEKRKLGELIDKIQENDIIIVTEISRLGRSMIMVFNILQAILEKNAKVFAIKENYEFGDNIQSKVLAFCFGISAEIERELISERTKQGLERARKEGKKIGRQKGQKPNKYKLTPYKGKIIKYLKNGRSKISIANEFGVSFNTLNSFINRFILNKVN